MILAVKYGRLPGADGSRRGVAYWAEWLRLFVLCYGEREVKPKHHWLLDVLELLARYNFVADSFIAERLHLGTKAIIEQHCPRPTKQMIEGLLCANVCPRRISLLASGREDGSQMGLHGGTRSKLPSSCHLSPT